METTHTPHMGNERAERLFLKSAIPDTEQNRRATKADARYQMNHLNMRFSDCVASSIYHFPKLASPVALSILEGATP